MARLPGSAVGLPGSAVGLPGPIRPVLVIGNAPGAASIFDVRED
jgi:hypothetical protein